jgi:hypothetical protein
MLRGEGFYRIVYTGVGGGSGFGLLAFETGKIYGVDGAGVQYFGDYTVNHSTIEASLSLTIPPGVWLVTGQPAASVERRITVQIEAPRAGGVVTFQTTLGPINAVLEKIGDFPS